MFEKAPYPEHPNRCQTINAHGQCVNLGIKLPDESYGKNCLAHGGNQATASYAKTVTRNYNLTIARFRAQLDEKLGVSELKSLREEISILRILLETRLNRCADAMDLVLQSGPISDMVMKINTVVQSCHKLEGSMGQHLDKTAILQFAQVIIGIVTSVVTDDTQINTIADEILVTVGRIGMGD